MCNNNYDNNMTYFVDPLWEIVVWTASVDDSSTVGFLCLVQGHRYVWPEGVEPEPGVHALPTELHASPNKGRKYD